MNVDFRSIAVNIMAAIGGVGGVVGIVGLIVALKANKHAKNANMLAAKANTIAQESNAISVDANEIAKQALDAQEDATKVLFWIEARTAFERVIHADKTETARSWLEITVINMGVEAEIAAVGLRKPGMTGCVEPLGRSNRTPTTIRMKPRSRQTFQFGDSLVTKTHKSFAECLLIVEECLVRTSCGAEFVQRDPAIDEYRKRVTELVAVGGWWKEDGTAINDR